jgi:N-acetylmuramoyl-L-alanine amidase
MKVRTNLYVLRRTAMPAVLVELGFITNPGDAALMSQQPQLFAQGIYQGLLEYLGL